MKGDPHNPADWRVVAERDLASAHRCLAAAEPHLVGFCLEQSAEKLLKGWLIAHGWSLVKTHDIIRLANECLSHGLDLGWFDATGQRLKNLYFTERYVDDSPDPDPDDAELALLLADVEKLHTTLFPPPSP